MYCCRHFGNDAAKRPRYCSKNGREVHYVVYSTHFLFCTPELKRRPWRQAGFYFAKTFCRTAFRLKNNMPANFRAVGGA